MNDTASALLEARARTKAVPIPAHFTSQQELVFRLGVIEGRTNVMEDLTKFVDGLIEETKLAEGARRNELLTACQAISSFSRDFLVRVQEGKR